MSHFSELAIPAGSLQCALYAFKGGADAVYLGAKLFSARNAAVNFSFEDMRRLKTFCVKNSRKFYVTVNTLIQDCDFEALDALCRQLSFVRPDGVIVQDIGAALFIAKHHPHLALHGSTQLAVHSVEGVKKLQEMGFTRVVLSRELSLEEIGKIRSECPDIELKVFIHGALCYGFSGQCLASQVITGRSANCGKCAQICRSWFSCLQTGDDGYFFSMKDLDLGQRVCELQSIGIESLKVEGRMKSPEYCYWTAKYYSMVLEGLPETCREVSQAREKMKISFARESTAGFYYVRNSVTAGMENLVSPDYPGHRGVPAGKVVRDLSGKADIEFSRPVSLRDGLLTVSGMRGEGFSFVPVGHCVKAEAGEIVRTVFPSDCFRTAVRKGTPVYCISRHDMTFPALPENIPLIKARLDIRIVINDSFIEVNEFRYQVTVSAASGNERLKDVLDDVFSASDKSLFMAGSIDFVNKSSFENPFIPRSVLKAARRQFYEEMDNLYLGKKSVINAKSNYDFKLPDRSLLGLWDYIHTVNGKKYMCLSPLMFNEEKYFEKLDLIVSDNPDIILGLNNIAQVRWAQRHRDVKVFADFLLYTSNAYSWMALKEMLPSLCGSYEISPDTQFSYTGGAFRIPMFISRVCFRHHGLGLGCEGCSKNNVFTVEQNGRRFEVRCVNCITVMRSEGVSVKT